MKESALLLFMYTFLLSSRIALTADIETDDVNIHEEASHVIIENDVVGVIYDLSRGSYDIIEKGSGRICMAGIATNLDQHHSENNRYRHSWSQRSIYDALGKGKTLRIRSQAAELPELLLDITIYRERSGIVLAAGLKNTTTDIIQLKRIEPLSCDSVFDGFDTKTNLSLLDGNGGAEPTRVIHEGYLQCRNNLLVTFGNGLERRSLVLGGLTYHDYEKFVHAGHNPGQGNKLTAAMYALDPVGRRIDPGTTYIPRDRFYVDAVTRDPFQALETYGLSVRRAQGIQLSIYDFPTVCLWYAESPKYGDGPSTNTSAGAVEEAAYIAGSGFLEFSRAAIRLVPDSYYLNNQQGWWDDEHWSNPVVPHNGSSNGVYVTPYETTKKWGDAVTERGVIPLTYFQTGYRSYDYAQTYPGHMLFNNAMAWKDPNRRMKIDNCDEPHEWHENWKRNRHLLWSYDFTDPDFVRHMQDVYRNLNAGGIRGLMYDYPVTGWAAGGGMENPYATTAGAYRQIFALAQEGLGADCYLHERNLERGSDITLGLVASQRIWGDTDATNPTMVTRGGLRWYKNRVVVNYDMDAKSLHKTTPSNRDGRRAMLTMAYVTGGRLLLGTSFARMDKDLLYDLSRVYPFHKNPKSSRPIDAFVRDVPNVYDFIVNPQWHQVTLYNPDPEAPTDVDVDLSGEPVEGKLGLNPRKQWYIYDFWNDTYVGKYTGGDRVEQTLRPGEAKMLSIHAVQKHPQFISTSRHLMQGYIDLAEIAWHEDSLTLQGISNVVADDEYKIVIALNGHEPLRCQAENGHCTINRPPHDNLIELTLVSSETGPVKWKVHFRRKTDENVSRSVPDKWKFVSIPDFLNVDVDYPEPKWDGALDYVLNSIKNENPDFVLVAGDMVMGRWWRTEEQIEYMADIYYTAWLERMNKHNLKCYVVPGDHELGDNPWLSRGRKDNRGMGTWDCAPLEFIPHYEAAFVKHFNMPDNGPSHMKGLTYSFVHRNTLFVAVDVFEKAFIETGQSAKLSAEQLEWLDSTLSAAEDIRHIVVFAHTPILGPVRKKSSSGLMYEGGHKSQFWQIMKKHHVDLYLCGEVHQITCIQQDGIEQISHGGLFGYNTDVNYLVVTVSPSEMFLELKEIDTIPEGRKLPQSAANEPYEYVRISPENKRKGFRNVGTMRIQKKDNSKAFIDKTGYFLEHNNPK